MDSVKRLVHERPVVIFSKTGCPVSHSMRQLITGFGANPTVYELDQMGNNGRDIEQTLQMLGRRPSVPSIFIGGNFVGGPNDLITLQVQGRLVQMLMDAGAIWVWNRN
ncbi:monothiol glutaredoxin-S6-like [Silene latifolia]|uniref:monothiol glutaredoxin-S6-like n=1 Tax=Silene latifolia TaxID=37657 RepID=UPI003D787A5B